MTSAPGRGARRFWPLLVVAIVAFAIFLYGRHEPVNVTANYHLMSARKDLSELHITWTGDGGKVVRVQYRYDGDRRTPPRIQSQALELPPDSYDVVLELVTNDGVSERIERRVEIESDADIDIDIR